MRSYWIREGPNPETVSLFEEGNLVMELHTQGGWLREDKCRNQSDGSVSQGCQGLARTTSSQEEARKDPILQPLEETSLLIH